LSPSVLQSLRENNRLKEKRTGYSKKISDERATDIGIKAFAYKPIVKADLAKTIRKVLDEK
jgi:hypothetical protein